MYCGLFFLWISVMLWSNFHAHRLSFGVLLLFRYMRWTDYNNFNGGARVIGARGADCNFPDAHYYLHFCRPVLIAAQGRPPLPPLATPLLYS